MNIIQSIRRHDSTPATATRRKHIPWIQSPLCEDGPTTLSQKPGLQTSATTQSGISSIRPDVPRFKHYDDTHTIELVYDMFFVATLSTFTGLHGVEDVPSLGNFIGFFTILWFTWLQTTMFDVRFGIDSVYDRVCKAITFDVTTSFMLAGSLWDVTEVQKNVKGFTLMAIALFISRLTLLVQYGVVAFYVRRYKQTLLPLGLMMATNLFVFENGKNPNIHIAFYAMICVEGLAMLLISCVWRVVSFKHTRFITRMTDATMIMLGEGVVGLAVSVARIMSNSASVSGSIGVTMAAVLLIYFTWMLYFDQIENDRFGTIRQQIWALLHYPLNLAMILLLEGMRELVAYNTIVSVDKKWLSFQPELIEPSELLLSAGLDYGYDFEPWGYSIPDVIKHYQDGIQALLSTINNTDNAKKLEKSFNATLYFDIWQKENVSLSTEEGTAYGSMYSMLIFTGIENFILEHFGVTVPKTDNVLNVANSSQAQTIAGTNETFSSDELTGINTIITTAKLTKGFWQTFQTVFWYFPSAAAAFLMLLAVMYWFGKRDKTRYEWFSIMLRAIGGLGMIGYGIAINLTGGAFESWGFVDTPWVIPVVSLAFFVIIIGDNYLIWLSNRAYDNRGLVHRIAEETGQYQHVPSRHGEGDRDMELSKMDVRMGQKGLS